MDSSARPSGSPTYPLDVFAALSADRKKLAISVVKPTETAQECELNLSGVQPSGDARLWQLTAPAGPLLFRPDAADSASVLRRAKRAIVSVVAKRQ